MNVQDGHQKWGRRWLALAVRLCKLHSGKQRVVAICLRNRKVISIGYNSYTKTHPRQQLFARIVGQPKREYLHAEMDALVKATRIGLVPDCIVVARICADGRPAISCPCCICSDAIRNTNPLMQVIHT